MQLPTVLLVEDDDATRAMIARHLHRSGFAVRDLASAEHALQALEGDACDVVVSDVHLPGASGIDLASQLMARDPSQPVVLITGDPDEALAREALSRGPVSYLLKPFELFELDAAVRQAMARRSPEMTPPVVSPFGPESIPDDWVRFVDERSYAGTGHAERVARICVALAERLPAGDVNEADLALAARLHELGRLEGHASEPTDLASRGARMLADAGFPIGIVEAVRHMHERWDGTGGPDGLAASRIPFAAQILAAADSLDHYCAAWLQAGSRADDAVARAFALVRAQQGSLFSPMVNAAIDRAAADIRVVLSEDREDAAVGGGKGMA